MMAGPHMVEVKSSNIAALGHDAKANELHVRFKTGDTWSYQDVDATEHGSLMHAESLGSHFHAHIKGAKKGRKL